MGYRNFAKTIGVIPYEEMERDAIERAIKALEKQMPKKPEYDCHKHLYICPHCGEYIVTYNQEFPYDMKCGGRLEW